MLRAGYDAQRRLCENGAEDDESAPYFAIVLVIIRGGIVHRKQVYVVPR